MSNNFKWYDFSHLSILFVYHAIHVITKVWAFHSIYLITNTYNAVELKCLHTYSHISYTTEELAQRLRVFVQIYWFENEREKNHSKLWNIRFQLLLPISPVFLHSFVCSTPKHLKKMLPYNVLRP